MYRKWLKHRGLSLKEGRQTTLSILPRIFDKDVLPALVKRSIDEIKPAQRHLFRHDSDLKKRISENTLNGALKRMGYQECLTGHGIRGTMSTALNEIGYPKVWVDAQLSHVDPNKVSATYHHAEYVEQRRRMRTAHPNRVGKACIRCTGFQAHRPIACSS